MRPTVLVSLFLLTGVLQACNRDLATALRAPKPSAEAVKLLESRIVFVSTRDGHQEIYVMDADGSGATRLTFAAPRFSNFSPNWSGRAADRVHERPRPRVRALRDGTRRIRADAGDGPDQFI